MRNSEMQSEVNADMSAKNNPALANEAFAIMLASENAVHKAASDLGTKPGILEFPAVVSTSDGKPAYTSWASEMVFGHQYTARQGDDLHLVAKRSLGVSGHPTASEREIRREMARILDLNRDQLPNGFRSHDKLPVALCLRLQADDSAAKSGAVDQTAVPAERPVRADAQVQAPADAKAATPAADLPLRADAQAVAPPADHPLRADAQNQPPLDLNYKSGAHPFRTDDGGAVAAKPYVPADEAYWGKPLQPERK